MKKEIIDLVFRILAWGLMLTAIILILLKAVGLLHSPSPLSLETLLAVGILIELGRLETKISLLWDDFRRRRLED